MKSKIVVHPQAEAFVRGLAPEPRRRLAQAIKRLPAGDTKALEGRLSGYGRLRVGGYRVIYELFEQILAEEALE